MSLTKNFDYQIYRSDLPVLFMVRNVYRSNLPVLFIVRKNPVYQKESMVKMFNLEKYW